MIDYDCRYLVRRKDKPECGELRRFLDNKDDAIAHARECAILHRQPFEVLDLNQTILPITQKDVYKALGLGDDLRTQCLWELLEREDNNILEIRVPPEYEMTFRVLCSPPKVPDSPPTWHLHIDRYLPNNEVHFVFRDKEMIMNHAPVIYDTAAPNSP